jgi:hypothetical protein
MSSYDHIIQKHAEAAVAEINDRLGDDFPERVRDLVTERKDDDGFPEPGGIRISARSVKLDVRLRGLRCCCGREVRDYDFELIDGATVRTICSSCHIELLTAEII